MSRIPAATACRVLDFLHESRIRHAGLDPASITGHQSTSIPVDRAKAAKVIAMPRRAVAPPAVETPSVEVLARVTESVDTLFPGLRGSMRKEMIATIGEKIAEDPHVRRLMA